MSDNKYIRAEHLNENEDYNNPSIIVFPNNFPKIDHLNDSENITWGMYSNKDKRMKEDKLLLGENEKISYEGKAKTINNLSE
jgi:hypothetical protein